MKLNVEKQLVDISGFENNSRAFKIKQSAKAFQILSSNIYSDKILAVVREYSTNAYDAHVSVGKADVPFEVHLPNIFEPWFAVRDFGPGLDHEAVLSIYTTYFESSKEDTNDQTGFLGLGSKSGFAYTDQFTITSYFGGKKSQYSAYVGEDGAPAITLIAEYDSIEPTGLEIYLPVKTSDNNTFRERAENVYRRFPVAPKVVGGKCDLNLVKYNIETPLFKMRSVEDSDYRSYAIQGVVGYPLSYEPFTIGSLDPDIRSMIEYGGLDIVFPMGDLNITASRETLEYDKTTQANIVKRMREVLVELPKQFNSILSQCNTLWEARLVARKWVKGGGGVSETLKEVITKSLEFKGQPLQTVNQVEVSLTIPDPAVPNASISIAQIKEFNSSCLSTDKFSPEHYSSAYNLWMNEAADTKIVYEDVRMKAPNATIRHNFVNRAKKVLVIRCDPATLTGVLEQMGNPPYVLASTLAAPPKAVNPNLPTGVNKSKLIDKITGWSAYGSYLITEEIKQFDYSQGGVFAPTWSRNLIHPSAVSKDSWKDADQSAGTLCQAMYKLANTGQLYVTDPNGSRLATTVYSLSASDKQWATDPAWTCVYDVIADRLKEFVSSPQLHDICVLSAMSNRRQTSYISSLTRLSAYKSKGSLLITKPNSVMSKIITFIQLMEGSVLTTTRQKVDDQTAVAAKVLAGYMEMAEFLDPKALAKLEAAVKKGHAEVDKLENVISNKYPHLFLMLKNGADFKATELANYINMCDKLKSTKGV